MTLHPRLSRSAVELVKRFEGYRKTAARLPDGGYTLGYGHTLTAREGATVSEADAEALLMFDLSRVAEAVEGAILAPANDNQFAAFVSFAFNIGTENFKGSSALRRFNEGSYLQAAAALELWRRADFGGDVLVVDQLVRRRAAEKSLFLTPPEGYAPTPSPSLRPTFDHSVIGAAVAWAAARERTAVGAIAMDGEQTGAELAVPPGHDGELAPSAAIAAADALSARLSRILPDDVVEDEAPAAEPTSLTTAEPEAVAPEPIQPGPLFKAPEPPANDAPANDADFPPVAPEAPESMASPAPSSPFPARPGISFTSSMPDLMRHGAPLPSMPAMPPLPPQAPFPAAEQVIFDSGFDLPPPPVARPDPPPPPVLINAPPPEPVAEPEPAPELEPVVEPQAFAAPPAADGPPPFVSDEDAADTAPPRRRFGGRFASALASGAATPTVYAPAEEEPSLFDRTPAADAGVETAAEGEAAPATPLFERPIFFFGLGLLGVALFAGSIFCMMNKASFTCLLIGVVGVLAMAPAAAFFLFRFLGQPIDSGAEEHADLLQMVHEEAPAAAEAAPAEKTDFDRTDWR